MVTLQAMHSHLPLWRDSRPRPVFRQRTAAALTAATLLLAGVACCLVLRATGWVTSGGTQSQPGLANQRYRSRRMLLSSSLGTSRRHWHWQHVALRPTSLDAAWGTLQVAKRWVCGFAVHLGDDFACGYTASDVRRLSRSSSTGVEAGATGFWHHWQRRYKR